MPAENVQAALDVIMNYSHAVAFGLGMILLWTTLRRVRGEGDDPSIAVSSRSDAGSASFLLSGVHYVGAIAALIAVFAWDAVSQSQLIAGALVGVVALHYVLEKRERGDI